MKDLKKHIFVTSKHVAWFVLLLATLPSCGVFRNRQSPAYRAGDPSALIGDYRPQGALMTLRYPCSVPGPSMRRMVVYLPAEYGTTEIRYPVAYLLHGARGYETSWIRKGEIIQLTDSLILSGRVRPFILVMPNVNQYDDDADFDGSRYKDAAESLLEVDGTVETAFVHDVVDFVDRNFRTLPDKAHRAVAGLSIGALQSIYLSANHPDRFDYVGVFSPLTWTLYKCSPYKRFYDKTDEKLAAQFASDPPRGYYIMTGKADYIHFAAAGLHQKLEKKGYPHFYVLSGGSHEWYNWKDYYVYLMEHAFRN